MKTIAKLLFCSIFLTHLLCPTTTEAQSNAQRHTKNILEAYKKIQTWRADEALEIVQATLKTNPEDPLTIAVLALMKFHLGDYQGAVEAFDKARKLGAPPQLLIEAEAANAAFVATKGYLEYVGEHFIIRYPPGKDEILVPYAEETLNAARTKIGELIGWLPKNRIIVELYPTAKTLAKVSSLTDKDIETSGTIALCRWNRLMVTTPRAVVFGYAWRDTIAHELTHLLIGGASQNTVPIWLHEGIAKYAETAWRTKPGEGIAVEQLEELKKALEEKQLIPFKDMHPSIAKLPSQEAASLAFTEVFAFIEYLVELKGWPGIRAVMKHLSEGKKDHEALKAVYGKSFKRLEKNWQRQLAKQPIIKSRNLHPVYNKRNITIKKNPEVPDDELFGLTKKARRFARAADLLFSRGRFIAAQKELEKAYQEEASALISAKLAMLALTNGDLDRAEQAARSAIESMPELASPNLTLARILLRQKKLKEMYKPLDRALDISPFDKRIYELILQTNEPPDTPRMRNARKALSILQNPKKAGASTGHGRSIYVTGYPFSRIYLRRGNKTFATGMLTPSDKIELSPGRWEIELVPPRGKTKSFSISLGESLTLSAQSALRVHLPDDAKLIEDSQ